MSASIQFVAQLKPPLPSANGPLVWLRPLLKWNDFRFKTSFQVVVVERGRRRNLGVWKVGDLRATHTKLPRRFRSLPSRYVSLGQDAANYEKLRTSGLDSAAFLSALNDLTVSRDTSARASRVVRRSLMRSSSAAGLVDSASNVPGFAFDARLPFHGSFTIDFPLDTKPLHRMVAVVGENGVGKTQLMAALARSLTGLSQRHGSCRPRPDIELVLAASFSAFDRFTRPTGKTASYAYFGLRAPPKPPQRYPNERETPRLDLGLAIAEAANDFEQLADEPRDYRLWKKALEDFQIPFERRQQYPKFLASLSAGQQLVTILVTRLLRHMRPRTLVLFDEPETHLHPAMLSALLRWLRGQLESTESFAILATQSPLPIQEFPGSHVRILRRVGKGVLVRQPRHQTFAENASELLDIVFGVGPAQENATIEIRALEKKGKSRTQVESLLGDRLDLGARLLLAEVFPGSVR